MYNSFEIIGLGYSSLDCLNILPQIPLDDKVEIIENLSQGGGPAATATVAAARLGAKAAFIGIIGDDERGKAILKEFNHDGVDTESIFIQKNAESPAAYCWIDAQTGKRSIAWTRGSISKMNTESLPVEKIRNTKLLHLDGHQTSAAIAAAKIAKDNGTIVSLDAGTMVDGVEQLVELADIVIASEVFARRFTDESDLKMAMHILYECGKTRFTAITMGSEGSMGFDGETEYAQPAFTIKKVVDTTGAGDVFHGAFVYKYVKGGSWHECLKFAAATAAIKCTKLGGRSGIPKLEDVQKFMEQS